MPLQFLITNPKTKLNGQIVIDRNTLTVHFTSYIPQITQVIEDGVYRCLWSDQFRDASKGNELRHWFINNIGCVIKAKLDHEISKKTQTPYDDLHLILDHISLQDKETVHFHFSFVRNVDALIMQTFISALSPQEWLRFLDAESFKKLQNLPFLYFENLAKDQTAAKNEQAYICEKEKLRSEWEEKTKADAQCSDVDSSSSQTVPIKPVLSNLVDTSSSSVKQKEEEWQIPKGSRKVPKLRSGNEAALSGNKKSWINLYSVLSSLNHSNQPNVTSKINVNKKSESGWSTPNKNGKAW